MGCLCIVLSSCSTSGEDVFSDFNTRTQSDSTDLEQVDSEGISLSFNLGDTVMEYEVEELNVNL